MKIGIDLDEVMAEFIRQLLNFYNFKYQGNIRFEQVKSYNFWENGMGKDREEAIKIVDEFHDSEFFDFILPVSGAIEAIKLLSSVGKVCIITSRPKRFEEKTNKFLDKYFDRRLKVFYSGDFHGGMESKRDICQRLGISVLVEDNFNYALDCANCCDLVFLIDKPWNRNSEAEGVVRVNGWDEILERLGVRK